MRYKAPQQLVGMLKKPPTELPGLSAWYLPMAGQRKMFFFPLGLFSVYFQVIVAFKLLVLGERTFFKKMRQESADGLMVNWWFGELVVWIPIGSPYERDCYLGVPLESQTTGPQTINLTIISWNSFAQTSLMFPKVPQSSLGIPSYPPPLNTTPVRTLQVETLLS